jgi:hypothetical protein
MSVLQIDQMRKKQTQKNEKVSIKVRSRCCRRNLQATALEAGAGSPTCDYRLGLIKVFPYYNNLQNYSDQIKQTLFDSRRITYAMAAAIQAEGINISFGKKSGGFITPLGVESQALRHRKHYQDVMDFPRCRKRGARKPGPIASRPGLPEYLMPAPMLEK